MLQFAYWNTDIAILGFKVRTYLHTVKGLNDVVFSVLYAECLRSQQSLNRENDYVLFCKLFHVYNT